MTKHYRMNAEITDQTFDELIEKIEGFDFESCALTDVQKVIHAVRLLAEETVRRHQAVRAKEAELAGRSQVADILDDVAKTLELTNPKTQKRRYFWSKK